MLQTAMRKEAVLASQGEGNPSLEELPERGENPHVDTPVTLDEFMQEFCTPLKKSLRKSRRLSLQSAARRGAVELPKHEGEWSRGRSKKYRPSSLMKAWSEYRELLPNLPELRPPPGS